MKRFVVTTLLLIGAFVSSLAQSKNHLGASLSSTYGFSDQLSYSADASIVYRRDISNIFHLGAGVGVGISKLNRLELRDVKSYNTVYVPIYVDAKLDFSSSPSRFYGGIKIGTRICKSPKSDLWVSVTSRREEIGGYYPYKLLVKPALGYEVPVGKNSIGIELCLDLIYGHEESITYIANNEHVEWPLFFGSDTLWPSVGLGITYEF